MKKTSNVIIKALIIAIILIAVLFLAPRIYYAFFYVDDSLSSEDNDVKLLTETYPTTFYFIGDTIALNDTIKVQNIQLMKSATSQLPKRNGRCLLLMI